MFLFSISFAKSSILFSFAKEINYLGNLYFMLMDHVPVTVISSDYCFHSKDFFLDLFCISENIVYLCRCSHTEALHECGTERVGTYIIEKALLDALCLTNRNLAVPK